MAGTVEDLHDIGQIVFVGRIVGPDFDQMLPKQLGAETIDAGVDEVLEISRYPEIVFESTAVSAVKGNGPVRVNIDGNLTLHGFTRPQSLPAQLAPMGDTLRANGEFTLRQTDYRIKLASVAGGALKLKDELKFTFDIVARRKSE